MAVASEHPVTGKDVAKLFNEVVIDEILDGIYHADNVPMDDIYQCVPTEMLGTLSSIERPEDLGPSGTGCDAMVLYNELVRLTTILTRVGHFTWVRTYNTNGVIAIQNQMEGDVLLNSSYVRTLATVDPDHTVKSEAPIQAFSISSLFGKLIDAWAASDRHSEDFRLDLCHSVCHVVCYSNCNCDCNCYK